ncbi:hypothetical protein BaRGS_00015537 [Batillaria attramentaria]|uniref:G-protein coupled receptors family 1 profile domain-containing protein n=1 Tax=Batillaria attramentaria TaxID=370345 RepID=A0ABD0L1D1_9CAEN
MSGYVFPLRASTESDGEAMVRATCPVDEDNTTVFTFFSEFNTQWQGQAAVESVILVGILLAAVTGNVTILLAIFRNPQLRTNTNLVIASLAVSDLLLAAGIPFILVTRVTRHWVFGQVTCKGVVYVQFMCGMCSILNLAFISVERYMHVKPSPSGLVSRRTVLVILALSWLLSVAFPVPVALAQRERTIYCDGTKYVFCGVSWPGGFRTDVYLASIVVIFFMAPLIAMCVCYTKLFLLVRRSSLASGSGTSGRTSRIQLRLIKMSAAIVAAFLLMLLPFFVLSFLGVEGASITSSEFTATLILALANTAANPLIYGYFNTGIRHEVKAMCTCSARDTHEGQV